MSNYNYNQYQSPGPGPHSPGPQPPHGDDWIDVVSWIVDIGLIAAWFPVGLVLTIAKSRGRDFVGDLIRRIRGNARTASQAPQYAKAAAQTQGRTTSSRVGVQPEQRVQPGQYARPGQNAKQPQNAQPEQNAGSAQPEKTVRRADSGARLREVFGWIITAVGILTALDGLISGGTLWSVLTFIAMAAGGGLLVFSGRQGKKKEAAFRRCITVSGERGIVRMKPLAKTLGMTEEELEKQLSEMIDRGYYGERAYIDHARELLVIEPEYMRDVYRAEDEAKAQQAKQQAKDAEEAQKAAMTEHERYIERIRQADIDIDDEVMSEKIRQMQAITQAIFSEVELHPEKKPQIERFMNYYLPTTLKLLESYARIEEQGVSGENTAKAKADIERIADTLVEGYRKQLDTLYQSEAVDIAGDVSVIESMMRRDGLTGQDDFRPFRQFVEPEVSKKPEEAPGQVLGGH